MKEIQIAPYREDCTITKTRITGTMDGRTFIFALKKGDTFDLKYAEEFIKCFQTAIAMLSKPYQVEEALNKHFGITGAKFFVK